MGLSRRANTKTIAVSEKESREDRGEEIIKQIQEN